MIDKETYYPFILILSSVHNQYGLPLNPPISICIPNVSKPSHKANSALQIVARKA
jgi:hypothetical protein